MVYEIPHQLARHLRSSRRLDSRTEWEVKTEWPESTGKHNRFWKTYGLGQSRIYQVVQEGKIPLPYMSEPGWTYGSTEKREHKGVRNLWWHKRFHFTRFKVLPSLSLSLTRGLSWKRLSLVPVCDELPYVEMSNHRGLQASPPSQHTLSQSCQAWHRVLFVTFAPCHTSLYHTVAAEVSLL